MVDNVELQHSVAYESEDDQMRCDHRTCNVEVVAIGCPPRQLNLDRLDVTLKYEIRRLLANCGILITIWIHRTA